MFFARSDWLLKLGISSAFLLQATPNSCKLRAKWLSGHLWNFFVCYGVKKATKFGFSVFTGNFEFIDETEVFAINVNLVYLLLTLHNSMIFLDADSFPVFSFDLYWDGVGRAAQDSLGPEAQSTARLLRSPNFYAVSPRFLPFFPTVKPRLRQSLTKIS